MHSYLKRKNQTVRQISDLRFGIPIILGDKNEDVLIFSIETLNKENFGIVEKYFPLAKSEPYVAITKNRASLLKARVYDDDIARIKIVGKASLSWFKATADPSLDLDYPMKGPFESIRHGNAEMARFSIAFCKEAQLLPAILVIPIDKDTKRQLKHASLLYQKVSDSLISQESDWNPNLISSGHVPLSNGLSSKVSVFRDSTSLSEHYAVEIGVLDFKKPILTRLHSSCFTGDVLHSLKCDCGDQLNLAINKIQKANRGIIIYLNQEGRGIGLANKMRAYKLQETGLDTFEANRRLGFEDDERDLEIGAKILKKLGVRKVRLLTNNPLKLAKLESSGIRIISRIPLITKITDENKHYLIAKKEKRGHIFVKIDP